ncbi:hypothetical protein MLD52_03140 [Puniceicoccaceae bacterium K14]|nr:hypothetical protein [Puniceicoccaceae bacterium K14]
MSDPIVYLILGSRNAGRRAVLTDLVEFGTEESEKSVIALSPDEPDTSAFDVRKREVTTVEYSLDARALDFEVPDAADIVFVMADGAQSPAESVYSFSLWLKKTGYELGRVLTILDCELMSKQKELEGWFDCCIHFSDIVLLSNRQNVSNKWIGELKDEYNKKRCFPCLFEYVKKGRLANPALALSRETRRISMVFEEAEPEEEYVGYVDDDEEEVIEEELEPSIAGDPEKDAYLKFVVSAKKESPIPDIRPFLS